MPNALSGDRPKTFPLRWQREELIVEYPPSLSEDEARAIVQHCFESGQVPPRGFNGELRLDCRAWGGHVEAGGHRYAVVVVRDTVTIMPA